VKIGTTQAQRKLFYKLKSARREMTVDGDGPSAAQVAEALGVTEADVDEMDVRLAGRDFFLDSKVDGEGGGTTHLEMLPAGNPSQEEELGDREERSGLKTLTAKAMEGLSEKERYVIEFRLMADDPQTLQEIGDHFGISRERARQIEANAIRKMKKALADKNIDRVEKAFAAA
jgi:RNA polymerase sigma-32 factor